MTPRSRRSLAAVAAAACCVGAVSVTAPATATASAADPRHRTSCDAPGDPDDPQVGGTSALHELESGGRERTYVLRLPDGYERRDDWPLVVAFHGRGSSGAEVEGYSELSRLPAVVAYPNGEIGTGDGYRRAWQGAPYAPPGVDDVAFTGDLLDRLSSRFCIDETRTYATGKSNGAGLVALLACRMPERLAAVAPVAGAYYPGTREGCAEVTEPAVPVMAVHGTGDTTIPYDGDADRGLPSLPDQAATWARRAGCEARPVERRTTREVTTRSWRRCADDAEVRLVSVEGGGHVWPGSDVYSGGGYTTRTIETSRLAWRFLRDHTRPTATDEESDR